MKPRHARQIRAGIQAARSAWEGDYMPMVFLTDLGHAAMEAEAANVVRRNEKAAREPSPHGAVGLSLDEFMDASARLAKLGISTDELGVIPQAAHAALSAAETFTHTRAPGTVPRAAEDKTTHPQGEQ